MGNIAINSKLQLANQLINHICDFRIHPLPLNDPDAVNEKGSLCRLACECSVASRFSLEGGRSPLTLPKWGEFHLEGGGEVLIDQVWVIIIIIIIINVRMSDPNKLSLLSSGFISWFYTCNAYQD